MSIQQKVFAALAGAGVIVAVFSQVSSADDAPRVPEIRVTPLDADHPMIEIGVAQRVSTARPGVDVILEAEFRGLPGRKPQQYWAHISGSAAINTADGSIPTLDVEITPYSSLSSSGVMPIATEMKVLPVHVYTDQNLGQSLGASIKAIQWGGGLYIPPTETGTIAATLAIAVQALGAKFSRYANRPDSDAFFGAYLGGIAAQLDLGYQVAEKWVVKVGIGAGVDFSVGDSHGLALQMESQVTGRLDVTYDKFLNLFAQGQFRRLQDTGNHDTFTVWEFLAGLKFTID